MNGGLIQAAVGFRGGFGGFLDEAFWIGFEGAIEGFLAGFVDVVGLTVVDLVWRHQADAGMVVVVVVPVEELADEGLCILDAAEALWELGLVF